MSAITTGEVDTVELVMVDMQGRLQGKRVTAKHFLDSVLDNGCEPQSYLLTTDVGMNTVDGYRVASWATGYDNLLMVPDTNAIRRLPWHPSSAVAGTELQFQIIANSYEDASTPAWRWRAPSPRRLRDNTR